LEEVVKMKNENDEAIELRKRKEKIFAEIREAEEREEASYKLDLLDAWKRMRAQEAQELRREESPKANVASQQKPKA
jgi:hypothetical protein